MRIIAGEHRGRKLTAPAGKTARPTSDRLRETIFNILEHGSGLRPDKGIKDARVADIFAGTGAMGLEALSRGAATGVFIEKHHDSVAALRGNIEMLGLPEDVARIMVADARNLPTQEHPFDIVFMDPPYGRDLAGPTLASLAASGWVGPDSLVVLEVPKSETDDFPGYSVHDRRAQASSQVLFLKPVGP